ncbi:Katanin p60 ATPase-containing subunit A-like 2, partial [Nowakowskiella sp. JEL0078]
MLAKAVATECRTTFFNISASSIVSKWRGDSEKLVRVLFDLARYHSPSTIFLDELEMDGLAKSNEHVFLLAASNLPWDLDIAMLRRLEKRILIDLPDLIARKKMFKKILSLRFEGSLSDDVDFEQLANLTIGRYSGSDIQLICKEAAMKPLRNIFDVIETDEDQLQEENSKININELIRRPI